MNNWSRPNCYLAEGLTEGRVKVQSSDMADSTFIWPELTSNTSWPTTCRTLSHSSPCGWKRSVGESSAGRASTQSKLIHCCTGTNLPVSALITSCQMEEMVHGRSELDFYFIFLVRALQCTKSQHHTDLGCPPTDTGGQRWEAPTAGVGKVPHQLFINVIHLLAVRRRPNHTIWLNLGARLPSWRLLSSYPGRW